MDKADVYHEILAYLDTKDIVRSQRICKNTGRLYAAGFTKWFNIYRHLSNFFHDPNTFRCLQAQTGAIVAGSYALQFFIRQDFTEPNLDIYVHRDAKEILEQYDRALAYLDNSGSDDGVELWDSDGHYIRDTWGIVGKLGFEKVGAATKRKVQLIIVDGTPLKVIIESHSTCVLNFLTFDTAYCLYPRATIVEKKSLLLKDIEDVKPGVRAAVRKYRRRGFTFIQLAEENDEELFHLKKVRWAMDLHAWSFDLPKLPQPYRLFTNYRSPAESTSWAITTYIDDYHRMRCDMWYDDPCIFPILHATIRIRSMFVDLLVKNEEYWVDMDHDVGGSDQ
ncbi:hypothetical protein BC629DRAFT_1277090 [Irpex lacteus]|nr:hypothetical protein BC629DRAFT_1277090 [Irpex lacteus]